MKQQHRRPSSSSAKSFSEFYGLEINPIAPFYNLTFSVIGFLSNPRVMSKRKS